MKCGLETSESRCSAVACEFAILAAKLRSISACNTSYTLVLVKLLRICFIFNRSYTNLKDKELACLEMETQNYSGDHECASYVSLPATRL